MNNNRFASLAYTNCKQTMNVIYLLWISIIGTGLFSIFNANLKEFVQVGDKAMKMTM